MSLSITNLLFLAGCLWLLLELLSVFWFAWEIPSFTRAIYHKVRGHIVVTTTDDIRVAAENGLIQAGSELVVNVSHEGNDGLITRFAIHPSLAGRAVGTTLRVVSVKTKRLVLKELPHSLPT
jgi:hypothetical protein